MLLWPAVSMAIILLSCPPPSSLCFRFWHPFHWCQLASSEILSDRAQQWYVLCVTLVKGYCLVCAASFCLSDSIFQCLFDVDFWLIVCFVIEVTGLINSSKIRCHSRSHVFVTVLHRQPPRTSHSPRQPHATPKARRSHKSRAPRNPQINPRQPQDPQTTTSNSKEPQRTQTTPNNQSSLIQETQTQSKHKIASKNKQKTT